MRRFFLTLFIAIAAAPVFATPPKVVPKPAGLVTDGIPAVPVELAERTRPYMEFRTAGFESWHPQHRTALITTRFGNTAQVHRVNTPGGTRTQLSFESERVVSATWAPGKGDVLIVQKDVGGDEFFQLYRLEEGTLSLLTDGKSQNNFNAWSHDGSVFAYSSTRRNGRDSDLYVIDPRNPQSNRLVLEVEGGGWALGAFSPDKKRAVVAEYVSATKSNLYLLDVATSKLTPIGDHRKTIAYGDAEFAPDGTLWVTSDEASEFQRLGTIDPATGKFTVRAPERWDVDSLEIAHDGSFIAYEVNEAGIDRLKLLDPKTNTVRTVDALPAGVISGLEIAPWGDLGFSFAAATSAMDMYSVDPRTLAVTRWTTSETGGLDVTKNVEPELVEVKSFDGKAVSGFLYRPNATRFPGKRPLIFNIHGGPEGQARPGFLGRNNYLLNELGIAIFYPNVRGSSGYGKTFISLDNGPFKREDSVKDIGAFLEALSRDATLDIERFAVTGGSYGGYMCYASAIRYAAQFKAANCVVAISNFVTFLENTQDYRRDLRRVEYGDERDPNQRKQLTKISPLTQADRLSIPSMIVTGGNDPRVPASEADQMIEAMRRKGGIAWHLLGTNEGHGFAKKDNQDYQFWTSLMFWQQTLLKDTD